jgi:hypothetical protein
MSHHTDNMSTTLPTEEPKSTKQKILEAGASLMQSKSPIKAFKEHLVSLSFISGDPKKQFILHHYINAFNDEFAQALLYDGDRADSKLVGIQYIISEKVFMTLPENEKSMWHSLHYMVKSGLLLAPSLPSLAEKPLMNRLSTSYGKTFMFWDTTRSTLPTGIPQLMMSFTGDGQATDEFVRGLFDSAGVKSADILKRREKVTESLPIASGADSWERGEVYQLVLEKLGGKTSDIDPLNLGSSANKTNITSQGHGYSDMGATALPTGYSQSSGSSTKRTSEHAVSTHATSRTGDIDTSSRTHETRSSEEPIEKSPVVMMPDQRTTESSSTRGSISPYDTSSPHYSGSSTGQSTLTNISSTDTSSSSSSASPGQFSGSKLDTITTNTTTTNTTTSLESKLQALTNLNQNDDITIQRTEVPTTQDSSTIHKTSDFRSE